MWELCTTVAGCVQGIPLIVFGTNMAFEGIQDLWYTLRGELDKESKNLIKEATGHKVDNLVELAEIGMSIYSGKVASKRISGKLGEESEKLSCLLKKTRKPMPLVSRTKRLVKKFMPKKRYRKFKVVDIEELAERQCLKPNIQLFAENKMSKIHNELMDIYNNIKCKNGKYYTDKITIDKIAQIEAKGENFSLLKKTVKSLRASTEGGKSIVYKYSDEMGTKYLVHEVTDKNGYVIHRDFDAVRIASGQLINKEN